MRLGITAVASPLEVGAGDAPALDTQIFDLVEAGVDGINPLSYSENMDPVEIRHFYPRLILWGGINERTVLTSGAPAEVRRVVAGVGRGLILGSTGGVHPACPAKNCVAMVEALRA